MEELESYLIRNNWLRHTENSYWFTLGNYYFIEVILNKSNSTAIRNVYDPHYQQISNSEAWPSMMMHKALIRFMENYNTHYIPQISERKLA
jgi:hypothetical protein